MEPIAIIGMACRFPRAATLASYWELLVRGDDAVGEPPPSRPELMPPAWLRTMTPACSRGGYLDRVDLFEPSFFRISPREAARLDPQQRLLLEVTHEALADAGHPVSALAGTNTGVFVGIMNADFARRHAREPSRIDAQLGPGSSLGIAPNRVSFSLDLRGPSLAVDTLCSSSLVAIHLACQSLQLDESAPIAIAGGVNVILDRTMDVFYARAGLAAENGRCRAFDADARGIVRGEGAGLLVLKRLDRARADGDRIHAVILGSAVNQDGRSNGLTSPSRWSQEAVLRTAYRRADVAPGRVSYVEAHGTGTLIGDPIEAAALGAVMNEERAHPLRLGSVKTNLGHLESAAGAASVIKTALSLSHGTLVPSLHFDAPNPYARLEERNLEVVTRAQPWPRGTERIAGVSSFGMGGTNAHLVLAAPPPVTRSSSHPPRPTLIPMSAHSGPALAAIQRTYETLLDQGTSVADLAHSAGVRRDHYDHRRAVVVSSAATPFAVPLDGRVVASRTHTLVFVFSELDGDEADEFTFQTSLAAQWRRLGFVPQASVGVGRGAIAAAFDEGTITRDEALRRLGGMHRDEQSLFASKLGEDSTIFLELGSRPTLQAHLRTVLDRAGAVGTVLAAVTPGMDARSSLLDAIGRLYCLGFPVDWARLDAPGARFVALGAYPWQRERCWLEPPALDGPTVTPEELLVPAWHRSARGTTPRRAGSWLVRGENAEKAILCNALEAAGHTVAGSESDATDLVVMCGDDESLDAATVELDRMVMLIQSLGGRGDTRMPRLWIVTRGARVAPGGVAKLALLARATQWGFARVVANELPRTEVTLIDLGPSDDLTELTSELLFETDETEIALRGSERFVERLMRQTLDQPTAPLRLRADGAYLITGGLGGLGLAAARMLAERGAGRIILLGRSGVTTDAARSTIADLEAAGTIIIVETADVADREELGKVLARHRVRGVIHAAGVMVPAMISAITPAETRSMLAAKVRGATNLHELTKDLDFLVLYSSVATLLGTPGQGAYAAANAFLDELAMHRRALQLPAISVAWTVIEGTGMAAHAGARAIRQLADRGLGSISVERANAVLELLLASDSPPARMGVVPLDVGRWSSFYVRAGSSPRFAPLVADLSTPEIAERVPEIRSLDREAQQAAVEDYLGRLAMSVLHVADAIEATRSLFDLGIDSLTALELQSMVEVDLGVQIGTERLLQGPTLRELAVEIVAQLGTTSAVVAALPTHVPVSLREDAILEPHLSFAAGSSPMRSIFLTGATGFLGAFVLAELLAQSTARVICLVRAANHIEGMRRLAETLDRYDLPVLDPHSRVTCVPGDLAQPRFGLTEEAFEQLARSIDSIVHSGASVNFVFAYQALRSANVHGTREILRLAAAGEGVRLHHVSTIGVFHGAGRIAEDAIPDAPDRLPLGYMRTKWVAEELVRAASKRGLTTTIFRPGTISGHSSTGAFNPDDFVCVLIKGCIELGAAPIVDTTVNLVPVDFASRALVRIALANSPPPGPYHLVGAHAVAWNDLVGWVRKLGYPLAELSYAAWRTRLLAAAAGNALAPLLPLFVEHDDTEWLHLPEYDDTRTSEALAGSGIACAAVGETLVRRYIERFVVSGYLPRPR